ncbi:MAG: hypothetical protein RQ745_10985 [Longimicrobiales bacterium]|nr:hypothetical protein [Longimicrobiales bacterium]
MKLQPGRVYRTRDFRRYDSNATRFAARMVREGSLVQLRKGLYHAPRQAFWGPVPPREDELLRAFFGDTPWLRTGPSVWNTLGLGTTSVEANPLVYNTGRTGLVELGGRKFKLRRVRFPRDPSPEFFVVDLLENLQRTDRGEEDVLRQLGKALEEGRFDPERLHEMAFGYGTRATQEAVADVTARVAG